MYGIEYQTIANLIKDDDNDTDDYAHIKSINSSNELTSISNKNTQNLLNKLQNLKKCPDYLLPKTKTINRSSSVASTLSTASNSSKSNKNYYTDDFILLSEFSEIEGPKPLLTIPTDGGTGFNKNEYSLHLMCVDFHSHVNLHQQEHLSTDEPIKRINKFNLTQDTSIINYWDSSNSVAACVHHFNLYDIEARGFVRPFCLAYISYDRTKPVVYFEQIRTRFSEITDLFKKSNFNLFKLDLEQRCLDLKLTRDVFLKWSSDSSDLKTLRVSLAKQHKLDTNTCARLTSSSTSEKTKQLQLNAIDSLIRELENVIDVIKTELKKKNWSKLNKLTSKTKINNSSDCVSSTNDSSIENTVIINRTNRSLTYPLDKNNTAVKVNCSSRKFKFSLRTPKVFTNILIGNLNMLQTNETDGFCSGIDFQQLNQSFKLQQHKTMKRLQQLSCHTAKQAINEMRLMQLYFSTPFYLLKFRELATPLSSHSRTNFWSIMCGEIALANFATHIDTCNLTKSNLTKLAHLNKLKSPNESIINNKLAIKTDEEDENETLINTDKHDSVRTQFYSPVNNERTQSWLINQSNDTNDSSDIEVISKITSNDTKSDEYFTTARETTWETAIEQFLDLETDNDKKDTTEDENGEEEDEFHDNYDEDTLSNEYLENNSEKNDQEESEYDFVNSLLTADYKPYNQYSTNYPDIGSSSLSLSSTFTSPAIVYSAYNRCKYQANLVDKLIQIIEFNFEETLKQLLNNYFILMPHLFYSLLKGRPVICVSRYCDDQAYLTAIVDCLSNFVPNSFDSLNDLLSSNSKPKFTSSPCNNGYDSGQNQNTNDKRKQPQLKSIHERKPIKLNDLKYCKLFGLSLMITKDDVCCSQDCYNNLVRSDDHVDTISLNSSIASTKKRSNSFFKHHHKHYHQNKSIKDEDESLLLKYIPITVRNYVSIFDIDKGTFTGPKYNGTHIKNCLNKAKQMQKDSIMYLYILIHLVKHYVKIAFIYNYSILFDHDPDHQQLQTINKTNKTSSKNSFQPRSSIDLGNTDRDIFNLKRERIRRYFALYNTNSNNSIISNELANLENKSTKSYYSSLSSLASSLLGYESHLRNSSAISSNNKNKKHSVTSFSDDDLEVLKVILSLIDLSSTNKISTTTASSTSNNNTLNSANTQTNNSSFDQNDFNIVNYLLKSLQTKQLYLYDLAMRKKHLKEASHQVKLINDSVISKASDSTSSTSSLIDNDIQFSLLIDYEELSVFSTKK